MSNSYEKLLNDDEFVELGELLAAMPEPFEPTISVSGLPNSMVSLSPESNDRIPWIDSL